MAKKKIPMKKTLMGKMLENKIWRDILFTAFTDITDTPHGERGERFKQLVVNKFKTTVNSIDFSKYTEEQIKEAEELLKKWRVKK